ncbi:hypothetical protein DRN67_01200 [Candidatus Micrarchaeota archaeon]|nr:MAG: hypothetical protein DRN67_01200 [Candidatus Micrarchaeota archaeon]
MKLTFYGGAREVGRNCIGLQEGRSSLLMDCGVNVGADSLSEEFPLLEDAKDYGQIAISHAHLDHVGYLPILYSKSKKFRSKIFATKPTHDLMGLLLADYQRLSNKFSKDAIKGVVRHCKSIKYKKKAGKSMRFSFYNSGHILGSSMVLVHSKSNLLFTSDVNNRKTRLLEPCHHGLTAKTLIMESTYGAAKDKHSPLKEVIKELIDEIETTLIKGGSILIPSFAVGRAQEILFILEQHMTSGALSPVPIFVDGMILKANRIYRQNLDFAGKSIKHQLLHGSRDPFKSKHFHIPKTRSRSDVMRQQAIIVSTSGMLTGGPAHIYLKYMADNPRNLLAFIGYQAEGTPGRRIVDGDREIEIDDQKVRIRMTVKEFDFSAHSDQAGLVQLARTTKGLERVFLIHGEPAKLKELRDALKENYEVIIPKNGENYRV